MDKKDNDTHRLILERRKKLSKLKDNNNFYRNIFPKGQTCASIIEMSLDEKLLSNKNKDVVVNGRMMSKRIMGKSSFANVKDDTGILQFYVNKTDLNEEVFKIFKESDIGDIVHVSGYLFKTKTGELTIYVKNFEVVTKSLRPLPEKYHGLADQEIKYRKRYLDLICNDATRNIFDIRFKAIRSIRNYFDEQGFIEVETPMMHKIPGGATARPFITHHNTLDMDLYMRIAPELFLKRLIVGGFSKIFEINRNFRNEGVSSKHNPEFTMVEFYKTFSTYIDMMNLTEDLIRKVVKEVKGSNKIIYQEQELDFSKSFKRMTMIESIINFSDDLDKEKLFDENYLRNYCKDKNINTKNYQTIGEIHFLIFEKNVESNLIEPTFITEYPIEISPLSRVNDKNKDIADRFEFFIMGKEIANGFSELNDPDDQKRRFEKQVELKDKGDNEAMYLDDDYIEALEYGMPPTAGEGIGIDRLVMILTDSPSIREVLLFPLMR